MNILFVCLGNICRSPMADAIFQHMVKSAGLGDKIYVDSAGTSRYHIGDTAHRGTLGVLKKHNIAYNGRARQFTRTDIKEFDYILAMDSSNLSDIEYHLRDEDTPEVTLFLTYAYNKGLVDILDVPDPYYDGRFDAVYDLITKGSQALLEHIRNNHNL